MDSYTLARRKAHAALLDAFDRAGIPRDYCVIPHQDNHERLLVAGEYEVRWLDDYQSYQRAVVHFDDDLVGAVVGDDIHRVVESRDFYGEDYGFERPFSFELPFDLTEIEQAHGQAWRELPKAPLRKRRKPHIPKVIGGVS